MSTGASCVASSLRRHGEIPSGPGVLFGFRFMSILCTPSTVMRMSLSMGWDECSAWSCSLSKGLNTDVYCSFKMPALPLASEIRTPSVDLSGGIEQGSFLLLLMKDQNF